MAAYQVTWSSDIKSNVTNKLPDPENLETSSMWFYFDELEPKFVLCTKFFKMAAVRIRSRDQPLTNLMLPMDSLK